MLVGALLARNVRADEWDKKTVVTFNEPVQIPGTSNRCIGSVGYELTTDDNYLQTLVTEEQDEG